MSSKSGHIALGQITPEILAEWWDKGVSRFLLQVGADFRNGYGSTKKAIQVFVAAVVGTSVIEFVMARIASPTGSRDLTLAVTLFGVFHTLSFGLFLLILCLCLRAVRAQLATNAIFSRACFAFSASFPFLMIGIFLGEQFRNAVELFLQMGDPSGPYLTAATIDLLFPQRATMVATARVWLFVAAEVVVFCLVFLYNLPRALAQKCAGRWIGFRVYLAVYFAIGVNYYIVHCHTLRRYWEIVGIVIPR